MEAVIFNQVEMLQWVKIPETIVVLIYLVGVYSLMFGILLALSGFSKRKFKS